MGTFFFRFPYGQRIWCLLFYYFISSKVQHIRRTASIFFRLQFCCQISCLIDFCLFILTVNIFSGINLIFCSCKCCICIKELKVSFLSGYSSQFLSLFMYNNFPFLFLIFHSQHLCFCHFQIDIIRIRIQFIPFRCSDFLDIHRILCLCQFRFGCSFFIGRRHLQYQICTSLISINSKNSPCKFYTALCVFFDHFNPSDIHPLNGKGNRCTRFFIKIPISNILISRSS